MCVCVWSVVCEWKVVWEEWLWLGWEPHAEKQNEKHFMLLIHSQKLKMSRRPSLWPLIQEYWGEKIPSTAWAWADWRHNTNEQAFSLFCLMSHDRLLGDAHRRPFWEVWPVTWPGTCMGMNKQFKRFTGSTTRYRSLALPDVAMDWYPPTTASQQITFGIVPLFQWTMTAILWLSLIYHPNSLTDGRMIFSESIKCVHCPVHLKRWIILFCFKNMKWVHARWEAAWIFKSHGSKPRGFCLITALTSWVRRGNSESLAL